MMASFPEVLIQPRKEEGWSEAWNTFWEEILMFHFRESRTFQSCYSLLFPSDNKRHVMEVTLSLLR